MEPNNPEESKRVAFPPGMTQEEFDKSLEMFLRKQNRAKAQRLELQEWKEKTGAGERLVGMFCPYCGHKTLYRPRYSLTGNNYICRTCGEPMVIFKVEV